MMIEVRYPQAWPQLSDVAKLVLQAGINAGHHRQAIMALAERVARAASATGLTANRLNNPSSPAAINMAIQILNYGGVYRYLIQIRDGSLACADQERQFLYTLLREMS